MGICLLVSEGDLNVKLGDVIKHVEEFQTKKDRHFGITSSDFHTLFWRLLCERSPGSLLRNESESNLYKVNLQDVALDILKYQDAYFNDEGESWDLCEQDPIYIKYIYDCSEEEFNTKQVVRKAMIEFFQELKGEICAARHVQDLLIKLGFTRDTLFACSRPGDNS